LTLCLTIPILWPIFILSSLYPRNDTFVLNCFNSLVVRQTDRQTARYQPSPWAENVKTPGVYRLNHISLREITMFELNNL